MPKSYWMPRMMIFLFFLQMCIIYIYYDFRFIQPPLIYFHLVWDSQLCLIRPHKRAQTNSMHFSLTPDPPQYQFTLENTTTKSNQSESIMFACSNLCIASILFDSATLPVCARVRMWWFLFGFRSFDIRFRAVGTCVNALAFGMNSLCSHLYNEHNI